MFGWLEVKLEGNNLFTKVVFNLYLKILLSKNQFL